jgi:hypothetical protein
VTSVLVGLVFSLVVWKLWSVLLRIGLEVNLFLVMLAFGFRGILFLIMGLGGKSRLGGILCLVFIFSVRIYTVPQLCNFFFTSFCSSCAKIWLLIYLLLKKKKQLNMITNKLKKQ